MRIAVWIVLVGASVGSVASGRLRVALALAALKALLVGLEFMELRSAAWPHLLGFVAFVLAVAGGLILAA